MENVGFKVEFDARRTPARCKSAACKAAGAPRKVQSELTDGRGPNVLSAHELAKIEAAQAARCVCGSGVRSKQQFQDAHFRGT